MAEEGTTVAGYSDQALRVWYVDPLDGPRTSPTAFRYLVSIGLCINRRPVLGVVEAPALGWTFAGTMTGGGSTFNGKPIYPSRTDRLGQGCSSLGSPINATLCRTTWPSGPR